MGTHPIFESDFDCLTEQKTKIMSTALKSGLTTRNKNLDLKRTTKKTTKAKVEIFKDSAKKRREANKKAEKTAAEKEKTEEIAENYWELLAEERRVKLEAAIEE